MHTAHISECGIFGRDDNFICYPSNDGLIRLW